MTSRQTSYKRATLEYDVEHERALIEALTETIFKASLVTDANVGVFRTGEIAQALLTMLACTLAISPSAVRSPAAIRKTCDDFGKSLRRKVSAVEQSADMQEFLRRTFRGGDVAGNA